MLYMSELVNIFFSPKPMLQFCSTRPAQLGKKLKMWPITVQKSRKRLPRRLSGACLKGGQLEMEFKGGCRLARPLPTLHNYEYGLPAGSVARLHTEQTKFGKKV